VNCSAITGSLIESELFGYRKGAFTGADSDYNGLFAAADQGTLFLDEIVEMDVGTQSKLLRSIQERRIRPVGTIDEVPVDVRFIAATNQKVPEALRTKGLREDLFHRLNVIQINMPPLRDMQDEIPDLLHYILDVKCGDHQRDACRFDAAALRALQDYQWPGNIREAANVVERCVLNCETDTIGTHNLPEEIMANQRNQPATRDIPTFSQAERDLVIRALRQSNGNKTQAAELLGISRPRLYKKIEQYDIDESSL
jgi:transcriptional regulator with PAS, ATPase and Fis domain